MNTSLKDEEIMAMQDILEKMAAGSFVDGAGQPWTGDLAPVGEGLERVRVAVNGHLVDLARHLSGLVGHMANTSILGRRVAEEASGQKEQTVRLSALAEEMTASIDEVASSGRSLQEKADAMVAHSREGRETVEAAVTGSMSITEGLAEVRRVVEDLDAKVRAISEVVGMIGDIARQTNLLSLNASIEAARAGHQGRSFGVVAEEVRKLAERTAKATKEVGEAIEGIQTGTASVAAVVQSISRTSEESATHTRHAGDTFDAIAKMIEEETLLVHRIASATGQQSSAMEDLAKAAEEMAESSVAGFDAASSLADEVVEAAHLAGAARDQVGSFKLALGDADLLELAKADHLIWKQRVYGVLLGKERIRPEEVASHRVCRLGRWYYGPGRERWSDHPAYQKLEDPHERLHNLARSAAEAMTREDTVAAAAAYRDLEGQSETILALLTTLQEECARRSGGVC